MQSQSFDSAYPNPTISPQSHSLDSASTDPIILTQPHLCDSPETKPVNQAQIPSLDSATSLSTSLAQPHIFDGPRIILISGNVSISGQSVGTNLPEVPAQSYTSSVPPDMSTTDNQSDDESYSMVSPAQTYMMNTHLDTPTTTSNMGSSSSWSSSATSSVTLDHVDNPTVIPLYFLNSNIQQPISVPTPTHSTSPPAVYGQSPPLQVFSIS